MNGPSLHRVAALIGVLACAVTALATIVIRADVDRLAGLADTVIDGKVEKRSVSFAPREGAIWTTYEIAVSDTLLSTDDSPDDDEADDDGRVLVSVPGGAVGDMVQEVSGTARLEVGQRAILFLTEEGDRLLVLGQAQGCFRVERDAETKVLMCRNDIEGLALVDQDGDHVDAESIEMRHESLTRRVHRVAERRAGEARRRREAEERKLAELRERAERNAERTRGKPGGAQ